MVGVYLKSWPVLENFCSGYLMVLSRKLVTCKIVIPSHDLNFHSRKIGWQRKPAVKGDVRPSCTYTDQNEKKKIILKLTGLC